MKRVLLLVFITLAAAYAALCLLMFFMQREMLYYPSTTSVSEQLRYAHGAGLELWLDANGGRIGWKRESAEAAAQHWLVMHGNAGHAVQRAYWVDTLERVSPSRALSVYLLEYPGYGERSGSPTETSLTNAALAAFDTIAGNNRLHLLGESLGCALAAQVVRHRPEGVGGLVLLPPFDRLADVASYHYPWLPVRGLVKDRWELDTALMDFPGPLASIAAERVSIVPARFAQRLHAEHPGLKSLHIFPARITISLSSTELSFVRRSPSRPRGRRTTLLVNR